MITGLPAWRVPVPGPPVETGALVARAYEVVSGGGDGFGKGAMDGDGDGDGETEGDGDGDGVGEGEATGATLAGASVAAEVFCG